ncbi:FFLEELY motif protein [Pseudoxanthomonas dokdonensis]|uniref:DUF8198 domain-containing protein n=1 Tax=Pseudoxanthomonas dokdonensis TaxID=344882 RepID=A0A0R0CMD5_9GAMM|nr:hypothetical protein [Pseudoxanthomonas dokdonensis]KRG71087.1 hypothetical protein ABB29_04515 [Pseudoxanthomonas dokdonensis]
MVAHSPIARRVGRRLDWHRQLQDPDCHPLNQSAWLPQLRQWQAQRLRHSHASLLDDPAQRAALMFFLSDVYGAQDFSRRDADIAKVIPMMQRLLPAIVLQVVSDGLELAAVTQALDLQMAAALRRLAPRRRRLDAALYTQAYRDVGHWRLRERQIDLIERLGKGLARAVRMPGVSMLLRLSRGPAKAAGVQALQGFLERGFAAFSALDDSEGFVAGIVAGERELSQRLFDGDPRPFDD